MTERTDAELFRLADAEPRAFHGVVDRHFRPVHRYLHRRAGRDLADDLAAEVFAIAFERRASCCFSGGSCLPWLYGIATHLLQGHRRKEARRLRAYARTGRDGTCDYADEAIARLDAERCGARLARILVRLPRRQRDALLLFALADLSYEETALALGVPLGTVKTWIHRARAAARDELEAPSCSAVVGVAEP